jgi:hypothetical protein
MQIEILRRIWSDIDKQRRGRPWMGRRDRRNLGANLKQGQGDGKSF